MRVYCPHCGGCVAQAKNLDGPNFCPMCRRLFYVAEPPELPVWILGVVTVLVAHWQIISQ
jgi:hypothetical protein